MISHLYKKISLLTFISLITVTVSIADPGGPGGAPGAGGTPVGAGGSGGGGSTDGPLDLGASFVLLNGMAFGVYKIMQYKFNHYAYQK